MILRIACMHKKTSENDSCGTTKLRKTLVISCLSFLFAFSIAFSEKDVAYLTSPKPEARFFAYTLTEFLLGKPINKTIHTLASIKEKYKETLVEWC